MCSPPVWRQKASVWVFFLHGQYPDEYEMLFATPQALACMEDFRMFPGLVFIVATGIVSVLEPPLPQFLIM